MSKGHILDQQRHERNDWWRESAHRYPIGSVVPRRVDESLQLGEQLARLGRQFLPRQRQSRHGHVSEAHHDGKQRIQVFEVTAVLGQLDHLAQHRHSLRQLRGEAHFSDDPILDLVEAAQEHVQVGGDLVEGLPAERLVQQLVLVNAPEQVPVEEGHVVGQLLHAKQLEVNLQGLRRPLLLRQRRQRVDVLPRGDEEARVETGEASGHGQVVVRDDDPLPGGTHLHEHQVLGGAQLELVGCRQFDVLRRGGHRAAQRAVRVVRAVHAEDDVVRGPDDGSAARAASVGEGRDGLAARRQLPLLPRGGRPVLLVAPQLRHDVVHEGGLLLQAGVRHGVVLHLAGQLLEEGEGVRVVEYGVADGVHPAVDELHDAALARQKEVLLLRGAGLDTVVPRELGNQLLRRHEHDVREEEVLQEGVAVEGVLAAGAGRAADEAGLQEVLQHLLRRARHHRVLEVRVRVGDLLEDEHILTVLFEAHRVGLHVAQDAVEVVLVHAQEVAVVLAQHDGGGARRVVDERQLAEVVPLGQGGDDALAVDHNVDGAAQDDVPAVALVALLEQDFAGLGVRLEHDDVRQLAAHRVTEVAERPDPHQLVVHHLQVVLAALLGGLAQDVPQRGVRRALVHDVDGVVQVVLGRLQLLLRRQRVAGRLVHEEPIEGIRVQEGELTGHWKVNNPVQY